MRSIDPNNLVSRPTFREQRQQLLADGLFPVVTVTGSRGKTTVIRLLETICLQAGLNVATWTSSGVAIEGKRQRGELGPWQEVQNRLQTGELDIAIRELDWAIAAAAHETDSIPWLVVTNLCANREECLITGEAKLAAMTLPSLLESVPEVGGVVLNGEDFAVSGDHLRFGSRSILAALSAESPLMARHLEDSGEAAWLHQGMLLLGTSHQFRALCRATELSFALGGDASFQVHNALLAAAAAAMIGVTVPTIAAGLKAFAIDPLLEPGSFNQFHHDGAVYVVDLPAPSWYFKPILRAVRPSRTSRLFIVLSSIQSLPEDDLREVGKLIGRTSAMVIAVNETNSPERIALVIEGILENDLPPHVVKSGSEVAALDRLQRVVKKGDRVLILSDRPDATNFHLGQHLDNGDRRSGLDSATTTLLESPQFDSSSPK